jgi:23S rRNA (guanosine2251-2'-O)-methyltransferase
MENFIEGRNPVIEALKSGREINKIMIQDGEREGSIKKIISMASDKKIVVQYVSKSKINSVSESGNHQGVIAYVSPYKYYELEEITDEDLKNDMIIVCDEITDPHNLGAIIRTADAAGASGIIIPKRRSALLTPTVIKSSAGATEYIKVCRVTNISRTVDDLKKKGYWVIGADMDGDKNYFDADLTGKVAIVVGSEGTGIGNLVKKQCDFLVKIPMKGKVSSLNASVAASILMYEVVRQLDATH